MARFKTIRVNMRVPLDPSENERRVRLFNPEGGEIMEGPVSTMLCRAAQMLAADNRVVLEWEDTTEPRPYNEGGMPE